MQAVLSALIVAGCTGYVVWTVLLPASARRRVRRALGRPAPAPQGCDGCASCARGAAAAGTEQHSRPQEVRWLPRQRG